MSCAGNGYLTGNQLVAFPFADGQFIDWPEWIDANEAQMSLQKCFVDAGINVNRYSLEDGEWPMIGDFRPYPDENRLLFSVRLGDAVMELSVTPSKVEFPIISGSTNWGWYSLTLSSVGIREFIDYGVSPSNAADGCSWMKLCDKCICMKPHELTSIRVYDGVSIPAYDEFSSYSVGDVCRCNGCTYRCVSEMSAADGDDGNRFDPASWEKILVTDTAPDFVLEGRVEVHPGYNMLIDEPESYADGDSLGFSINASAGAGLGRTSCGCSSSDSAKSLLVGVDGHARFFNDACYDIEPRCQTDKETGERFGEILLHAKCTACCTCDMYSSIVNDRLAPLAAIIRECKTSLSEELGEYERGVYLFNKRIQTPTVDDITLSLTGVPVGKNVGSKLSGSGVSGNMQRCAFTAILRNSSYATITASVFSISGTDTVIEASAAWADQDGNQKSLTKDSAFWPTISLAPGHALAITYVSRKNAKVKKATTGGYVGKVSIGVTYRTESGKTGNLGTLEKSVKV